MCFFSSLLTSFLGLFCQRSFSVCGRCIQINFIGVICAFGMRWNGLSGWHRYQCVQFQPKKTNIMWIAVICPNAMDVCVSGLTSDKSGQLLPEDRYHQSRSLAIYLIWWQYCAVPNVCWWWRSSLHAWYSLLFSSPSSWVWRSLLQKKRVGQQKDQTMEKKHLRKYYACNIEFFPAMVFSYLFINNTFHWLTANWATNRTTTFVRSTTTAEYGQDRRAQRSVNSSTGPKQPHASYEPTSAVWIILHRELELCGAFVQVYFCASECWSNTR